LVPIAGWGITINDAMQEQHQANKQYVQQKKAEGKSYMTDTYSDVGILYWLFD
jgi:hypothetical protein